jgi:hypothetical protein
VGLKVSRRVGSRDFEIKLSKSLVNNPRLVNNRFLSGGPRVTGYGIVDRMIVR